MADLIIKPTAGSGNKLIFKDQAGGSIITTADSGGTIDSGVTWTSPVINTGISGSAFLDEDAMGSNSATKVASQQSIKAYVDATVTAQDLDFQGDSGGALNIDLDSEVLDIAGGTGITTTGSGNEISVAHDAHTGDVTGSAALTIADNAVTLAKMASGADGSLITYSGSQDPELVAPGNTGEVLTSRGNASTPTFQATVPSLGTNFTAVADGAIANGDPLILNTNGTVSSIVGANISTTNYSTSTGAGGDYKVNDVISTGALTGVVVYINNYHLYVRTYTLSSDLSTISFGSALQLDSGVNYTINAGFAAIWDASISRVVVVFNENEPSSNRKFWGVIISISGTTCTKGTTTIITSGAEGLYSDVCTNGANKFLLARSNYWQAGTGSQARFMTVTGGSMLTLSMGTQFEVHNPTGGSGTDKYIQCENIDTDKWMTLGNCTTTGMMAKIIISSGTNQGSSGSEINWDSSSTSGNDPHQMGLAKISTTKVIVVFCDNNASSKGVAVVATISGSSLSFGTQVIFEAEDVNRLKVVYNSVQDKIYIGYSRGAYAYIIAGTVTGTVPSFETRHLLNSSTDNDQDAALNMMLGRTDHKMVGLENEKVYVHQPSHSTMTADNYVGIADAAYVDTVTATVQGQGVVDDAQSSLTIGSTYYVQSDGTLGLSAVTPSVVAGKAISTTKLRIDL